MHYIELWRWRITDPWTSNTTETRYVMTVADALATDPAAQRIEGTLEVRPVPDEGEPVNQVGMPKPVRAA